MIFYISYGTNIVVKPRPLAPTQLDHSCYQLYIGLLLIYIVIKLVCIVFQFFLSVEINNTKPIQKDYTKSVNYNNPPWVWSERSRIQKYSAPIGQTISTTIMATINNSHQ